MLGWIKMPLGKELGLGPSHIVLDGDPVGTQHPYSSPSPLFGPCLLSPISATRIAVDKVDKITDENMLALLALLWPTV